MGEVVRIQTVRQTFSRPIHVRNTYELFTVKTVNESHVLVTYTLQELDGGDIQGILYRGELTPVQDKGLYVREILKTRERKSETQYLTRYAYFSSAAE